MCRLFGFRSIINSQVHSSLVNADNTLHKLSEKHPDGWGVAYYIEDTPHLIKSTNCAMEDQLFHKVSGLVSSQTVVAHIRKATQGQQTILNSHPFQYGKWIFAHNGNIKNFLNLKDNLLELIKPELRKYILGSTDSEIIFFCILSELSNFHSLGQANIDSKVLIKSIKIAITKLVSIIGKLNHNHHPVPTENYLSFVLSSGKNMVAFNGGQDLFYCTYKSKCPERDTCRSFASYCEKEPDETKVINHLIVSSEAISGPNIWHKLKPGELVGVDTEMRIFKEIVLEEFI